MTPVGSGGGAVNGGPAVDWTGSTCSGVTDQDGNLVLAGDYSNQIWVVAEQTGTFYGQAMTAGDVYTIAGNGQQGFAGDGGPATQATLDYPSTVSVDSAGDVLFADSFNFRVRMVTG